MQPRVASTPPIAGTTTSRRRSVEQIRSGNLTLSGANSWSGGALLLDGTLTAASSTALGTGDVYRQGGTLAVTGPLAGRQYYPARRQHPADCNWAAPCRTPHPNSSERHAGRSPRGAVHQRLPTRHRRYPATAEKRSRHGTFSAVTARRIRSLPSIPPPVSSCGMNGKYAS